MIGRNGRETGVKINGTVNSRCSGFRFVDFNAADRNRHHAENHSVNQSV